MAGVRTNCKLVKELEESLPTVALAMQEAEEWLAIQDQVRELRSAVDAVALQIRNMRSQELADQVEYSRHKAEEDLIGLAVDFTKSLLGERAQRLPNQLALMECLKD